MNYADFTSRNSNNPIQSDQSLVRTRPTGGVVRRKDYNAFTYNSFKVEAEGPLLATFKTPPAKVGNQFVAASENSLNKGTQGEKLGNLHKVTIGEPEAEKSEPQIPNTPPPPADAPPLPPDIPPPPNDMPPLPPDIPPPPPDTPPPVPNAPPPVPNTPPPSSPTDTPPPIPNTPPPPVPPGAPPPIPNTPPPPVPPGAPPPIPESSPPPVSSSSSPVSQAKQETMEANPQKLSTAKRLMSAIKNSFLFNKRESTNVDYLKIDINIPFRSYDVPSSHVPSSDVPLTEAAKNTYYIVKEISETEVSFKNLIKEYAQLHKSKLSPTSQENLTRMVDSSESLAAKFNAAVSGKEAVKDIIAIYNSPEFQEYADNMKNCAKEISESIAWEKKINDMDKKAAKVLGQDLKDLPNLRKESQETKSAGLLPRNIQTLSIVQRMPRHESLVTDLIKKTPQPSEDYDALQLVLAQIQQINKDINSVV